MGEKKEYSEMTNAQLFIKKEDLENEFNYFKEYLEQVCEKLDELSKEYKLLGEEISKRNLMK